MRLRLESPEEFTEGKAQELGGKWRRLGSEGVNSDALES